MMDPSSSTGSIQLVNISKKINKPTSKVILDGINLLLQRGSKTVITGNSGSGKSSLLHIMGLIDSPTEGSMYLNNEEIDFRNFDMLSTYRLATFGYILQTPYLLKQFDVLTNIQMPLIIQQKTFSVDSIAIDQNYFDYLIKLCELESVFQEPIHNLSGGELQRVSLCRALIHKPSIILADEPASQLDSHLTDSLFNILDEINMRFNTTLVVVTHNQAKIGMFDNHYVMQDGKFVNICQFG